MRLEIDVNVVLQKLSAKRNSTLRKMLRWLLDSLCLSDEIEITQIRHYFQGEKTDLGFARIQ